MRWPRVVLVGSVVLLCLGSPISRSALARETWSEVKHVQILEGPDTIWVFVEVVRITDYTDELFAHLMSKHPDEEIVSQSVFTIDRLENVTKTAIAKNTGPGLDPDLNPIFRLSDGFYQYDAAAMGRPASLFRWRGDRFSPLDERESKELKKQLGDETFPRILDELKAISEREGWRCVADNAIMFNKDAHPFVSTKQAVRISVQGSDDLPGWRSFRPSSVVASSLSKTNPWSRTLIEVDTKGEPVPAEVAMEAISRQAPDRKASSRNDGP